MHRPLLALVAVVVVAACDGDPLFGEPPPINIGEGEGEGEPGEGEGEGEVGDCAAVADASFGPAINLVTPRSRHTASHLGDGRVLVVGGEDDTFVQIADVEIVDVDAGTSVVGPPLNNGRYEHAAVVLGNGDVVVAGGFGPAGHLSSIEVFDGVGWTVIGDLDDERAGLSGFLVGGKAVFFGGDNTETIPRTVVSVDEAGVIETLPGVDIGPNRRLHAATQDAAGDVVVVGGFFTSAIDAVTSFDLGGAVALDAIPGARRQAMAGLIGAGVVVAGGQGAGLADDVQLLGADGQWARTGTLAEARIAAEVATFGDCLAVCGGLGNLATDLESLSSCEGIDADGKVVPMTAALPVATFSFTLTDVGGGRALFVGGTLDAAHFGEARLLSAP